MEVRKEVQKQCSTLAIPTRDDQHIQIPRYYLEYLLHTTERAVSSCETAHLVAQNMSQGFQLEGQVLKKACEMMSKLLEKPRSKR